MWPLGPCVVVLIPSDSEHSRSPGNLIQGLIPQLGGLLAGSINLQPDGWFPNHTPNPEDKKAVEATRKAVLEQVG